MGAGKWAEAAMTLEAMVPLGAPDNHPVISLQASADMIEAAQRAGRHALAQKKSRNLRRLWQRDRRAVDAGAPGSRTRTDSRRRRGCRGNVRGSFGVSREQRPTLRTGSHPLVYGEQLRRLKRRSEARTQLRSALDIFERLGAAPWKERTRSELRATGETARKRDPSTLDQLTPQEVQIVRRVAEGATN
jgi:hypothetical protein